MTEQALSRSSRSTRIVPPRPTPHRAVISLALVLFSPNLWLVVYGNLSVQTALIRFIGALLFSWVAARLVLATVSSFRRPVTPAKTADPAGQPVETASGLS